MTNTKTLQEYNLLIDGRLSAPKLGRYYDSINPSDGTLYARIADASKEDMFLSIDSAHRAFVNTAWRLMAPSERGIYLKKIVQVIRTHAKELAQIESSDTGKPIKHTTFIDVPTCVDTFEYFSDCEEMLKPRPQKINAPVESMIIYEPVGVIGCIIPWNYPLIMAAWKVAPALAAGNTVILKPSIAGCASIMRLAELINEAGLPAGVLNIVPSSDVEVARILVESPKVGMISFTGSTNSGRDVMRLASKQTKKIILELGGKSPNIVFSDCQMDAATGGSLSAIFLNQGQMCTAGSRLLVEESFYEEFVGKLIQETKKIKIGRASDYQTNFGPLATIEHRDKVLKSIHSALQEGAHLACGGKIPDGEIFKDGAFIEPTILVNVANDMNVAQQEIFGPVVCVIKFKDEEEAIKIANDISYGLAASIWTKDLEKANRLTNSLQCGTVWVNTYGGFYNEVAFGGFKQSGWGRELGEEGLLSFTHSKHICTDKTPGGIPLVAGWF